MSTKTKQQAIKAATTGAFTLVGFQFFTILLIKGWRILPVEAAIALTVGCFLGWTVLPRNLGTCVKIGVITGLIAGYALIVLMEKDV